MKIPENMDVYEDWDFWDSIQYTDDIPDELKTIEGYEEWKTIDGFPDYEVSIYGEVYSKRTGKILSAGDSGQGYALVVLCDKDGMHTKKIHRLVAEAFIPNPLNKPHVNHKDTCKRNNRVTNLEWNTVSENMKHAYAHGLIKIPDNFGAPKRKVRIVETGQVFESISDCARYLGVNSSRNHIGDCLNGKRNTCYGFHYEEVV